MPETGRFVSWCVGVFVIQHCAYAWLSTACRDRRGKSELRKPGRSQSGTAIGPVNRNGEDVNKLKGVPDLHSTSTYHGTPGMHISQHLGHGKWRRAKSEKNAFWALSYSTLQYTHSSGEPWHLGSS
ncbi:hypothetical protein QR685DRAFT_166401 [Neurospora intermedia]|uniref:Secreted protein n=1 Tax=Neurospora intermedia TaxID=5142 RepID=A0ABR3DKH6_NEUIN